MELELDVWWNTDEAQVLEDMEIELNVERDCVKKKHTFYQINFIRAYIDEKYCVVSSGFAEEMIVASTYAEVKRKINEQRFQNFN